jgi:diacylglycerol O-acyltransferase
VQSYDQSLDFGLMAGSDAAPDVKDLAAAIAQAYAEVLALPLPQAQSLATLPQMQVASGRMPAKARAQKGPANRVTAAKGAKPVREMKAAKPGKPAKAVKVARAGR